MAEKLAKVRVQIVDEATKLPKENVDVITSADAVYFPDGQTFQEKWENGDFKGDPGEDGAVATVKVGETITINPGTKAIVENVGTKHAAVLNFAIPKGEKGEDGTSIKILGRYDTEEELLVNYPNGVVEDGGFMIGPEGGPCDYYFWNKRTLKWESIGGIHGPQGEVGEKGDPGEDGRGLQIKTSFPNYAKLVETYPDGSVCEGLGCITLDTREYWYWDIVKLKWVSAGCIIGNKGDTGTINVGNVKTGPAGSSASVTNVGTNTDAIFDFVIPKGDKGEYAEVDSELNANSDNPISNKGVSKAIEKVKYILPKATSLTLGGVRVDGDTIIVDDGVISVNRNIIIKSSGPKLEECTPKQIQEIVKSGMAPLYWNVGDKIPIKLNGTIGNISVDDTYYVYIIGFNHNSEIEGNNTMHLQFGKDKYNRYISLCDDNYYKDATNGFVMNTVKDANGWSNSYMRNTICPQFLSLLPSDWQAIIASCTKYTNSTNTALSTTTSDKIWLLSEYEITGRIESTNPIDEINYQKQYEFYANGNEIDKFAHVISVTNAVHGQLSPLCWWTRTSTPSLSVPIRSFVGIACMKSPGMHTISNDFDSTWSLGFSPGFMIA